MAKYKFSPKLLISLLIAVFFGVSLTLRIALPYHNVFVGDWIKFTSNDSYFSMRLVDIIVHNFPHLVSFDPYLIYPGGSGVSSIQFFSWIIASISWVIGLGSPSQHTVDVIGVYLPAVLAALTVIPVYFIGKALFNRWAGVIAAALIAILPGEFMGRSILGFTDYHVAETLFSTTAVLFLILAIKTARQRGLTLGHLRHGDWATSARPLIYSALAGIFLGIYLITWAGALLFVFIITLYFIIQFIIDHLRRKSVDYLGITGIVTSLIALIIFLPFIRERLTSASLAMAVLIPLVLMAISRVMAWKQVKPAYYLLALIGIGAIITAIFYAVAPDVLGAMWAKASSVFLPAGATATTTMEMQPFLSPQGSFSTAIAWGNFTTSFFLIPSWPIPGFAIISFIILIILFIRQRRYDEHWLLFFVWTLVILVATLAQRRFAYYLVVNIALLSAYISWQAIWLAGLRKLAARPQDAAGGAKTETAKARIKKREKERRGISIYHINTALAIIAVFFFVFFFNITKVKEVAAQTPFAPSDGWQAALTWMKDNTPDPFADPDAYYRRYEPPASGENFTYPRSAYGVTAWWDYGYWITRIAHRLPSANPSQDPKPIAKVANLFLSDNETLTREIMEELDSSYIIADYDMATSKFWAVITWAGRQQSDFFGTYYLVSEGKLQPVQVLLPEYYRTLLVRLYTFGGEAVTQGSPLVIPYTEESDSAGNIYKVVTDTNDVKDFPSYQEAVDYIASQNSSTKYDIVGSGQFTSPVPLEAVPDYKLAYSSDYSIPMSENSTIPEVKIFEYTGGR